MYLSGIIILTWVFEHYNSFFSYYIISCILNNPRYIILFHGSKEYFTKLFSYWLKSQNLCDISIFSFESYNDFYRKILMFYRIHLQIWAEKNSLLCLVRRVTLLRQGRSRSASPAQKIVQNAKKSSRRDSWRKIHTEKNLKILNHNKKLKSVRFDL